jgi:virginiamycin A acetyltransferase
MLNKFLYKLYFIVPQKFRGLIQSQIVKREGGQMYSPTLRAIYKRRFNIEIGYGSYGGCFNAKDIPAGVSFGNYCSIAPSIRIFRANHPKDTFTSHPLLYNPVAGYVDKDQLTRPALKVGHDVWIGEWAVILPGVKTIGNGAMIGAGSIVTKDVEPYTVVGGNPAKKNRSKI